MATSSPAESSPAQPTGTSAVSGRRTAVEVAAWSSPAGSAGPSSGRAGQAPVPQEGLGDLRERPGLGLRHSGSSMTARPAVLTRSAPRVRDRVAQQRLCRESTPSPSSLAQEKSDLRHGGKGSRCKQHFCGKSVTGSPHLGSPSCEGLGQVLLRPLPSLSCPALFSSPNPSPK